MTCFLSLRFERSLVQTRLHRRYRQLQHELHRVDAEIHNLRVQLHGESGSCERSRTLQLCHRRTNQIATIASAVGRADAYNGC